MRKIDKIRKIAVMTSVFIGIAVGIYEKSAKLPQYEGIGAGFAGEVRVLVSLDDKKIESINVVEHSETIGISDPAFAQLIPVIIEKQNINVDNVAGATYTSVAIKEAVKDAAAKAGLDLQIEEITEKKTVRIKRENLIKTTGSGEGYLGDIIVEISKSKDEIVNIEVISHGDTKSIADPALEELKDKVIENQNTDIDMIAGATWTSEGFIDAVKDALEKTKN